MGELSRIAGGRPCARDLRARLEAIVDAEIDGQDPRLVEQTFSPLGAEAHVAAVRRRLRHARAHGLTPRQVGALRLGTRYLLTAESLAAEIALAAGGGL